MSFINSIYRYNQALERGRASLKIAIGILSLWATFLVLTMNFTRLSLLANAEVHLYWGYYTAAIIYFIFAIILALIYGFKAADSEHKSSDILIDKIFSNSIDEDDKEKLLEELNVKAQSLESNGVKSFGFNLIAIISLVFANVMLFITWGDIWNVIKEFKIYLHVIGAIILSLLVCFWPKIKSFFWR